MGTTTVVEVAADDQIGEEEVAAAEHFWSNEKLIDKDEVEISLISRAYV